jgi:hypothetical protein
MLGSEQGQVQTGLDGEQASDAGVQPPPAAAVEQAVVEVDAVPLVQVGFDQRPLREELRPAEA